MGTGIWNKMDRLEAEQVTPGSRVMKVAFHTKGNEVAIQEIHPFVRTSHEIPTTFHTED